MEAPDTVVPQEGSGATIEGNTLSLSLPPYSYSVIRVTL